MSLDEAAFDFVLDAPANTSTDFYLLINDNIYSYSSYPGFDGDLDVYFMIVQPGHSYSLVASVNSLFEPTVTDVDFNIYDRYGNYLYSSVDYGDFSGQSFIAVDSLYYVGFYTGSTGHYGARLVDDSVIEANPIGNTVFYGEIYSAALDFVSDVDSYNFYAEAGETYLFALDSDIPDIFLTVEYNLVRTDSLVSNGGGLFTFSPNISGYYTVQISSNSFVNTGDYTLVTGPESFGEEITGTSDPDALVGTFASDLIFGLAGNDGIDGEAGADLIDGGEGFDLAIYLYDPSGVVVDLQLDEAIDGWGFVDELVSIEAVIGSNFEDYLIGDAGDNYFVGNEGADTINGNSGFDFINYIEDPSGVFIDAALGTALDGWGDEDSISNLESFAGSDFDDEIRGSSTSESFLGNKGNDTIEAGAGNDIMSGMDGNDEIHGGAGEDTAFFDGDIADYEIIFDQEENALSVTEKEGNGYKDILFEIEYLKFGDLIYDANQYIPNNFPQGSLLIYGDAIAGNSLIAEPRSITDEDGLGELSYQWYRNGEAIQGLTSNTYLLSSFDDGQLITASVSYEDGAGNEETLFGESRLATDPTSDSYTDLIEMYVIILGRAPAQGGMDFWSGFINQGKDFEYIAGEMWNSAGAREFYPSDMSTEEVVTSVYTNILVREPKEAGLNFWVDRWEEVGPVKTMLEMIGALTANNSSDPLAIADKELFQAKVDIGGYLANTVQNTDVDLASTAFDYLEAGYTVEDTKNFIDTEMGMIGQAQETGGDDLFA